MNPSRTRHGSLSSVIERLSLFAVVGATACGPQSPAPIPDFNAADPSLTCEAGKVGWDFSTGGNTDDVKVLERSNELRIVEATVGEECGASPGNRTESFARSCNGLAECTRSAVLPNENHPTPQCAAATTRVKYQCGVEDAVYESRGSAVAGNEPVSMSCGPRITIVSASLARNCLGPDNQPIGVEGNSTAPVVNLCNGLRVCELPEGVVSVSKARVELQWCGSRQVEPEGEVRYRVRFRPDGANGRGCGAQPVELPLPDPTQRLGVGAAGEGRVAGRAQRHREVPGRVQRAHEL